MFVLAFVSEIKFHFDNMDAIVRRNHNILPVGSNIELKKRLLELMRLHSDTKKLSIFAAFRRFILKIGFVHRLVLEFSKVNRNLTTTCFALLSAPVCAALLQMEGVKLIYLQFYCFFLQLIRFVFVTVSGK